MKVIFTDTVQDVAFKGDVKNIKPGYFRNYLLPYNKAVLATPVQLAIWDKKRQQILMEKEQVKQHAEEVKGKLENVTLKIQKKVTSKGTLYSAITAKDIVRALGEQAKMEIAEHDISLKEHIKELGTFEIPLKLASNVDAVVRLEVTSK